MPRTLDLRDAVSAAFSLPDLPRTLCYDFPTVATLGAEMERRCMGSPAVVVVSPPGPAVSHRGAVDLLGMAVRFPEAEDVAGYWALLSSGRAVSGPRAFPSPS